MKETVTELNVGDLAYISPHDTPVIPDNTLLVLRDRKVKVAEEIYKSLSELEEMGVIKRHIFTKYGKDDIEKRIFIVPTLTYRSQFVFDGSDAHMLYSVKEIEIVFERVDWSEERVTFRRALIGLTGVILEHQRKGNYEWIEQFMSYSRPDMFTNDRASAKWYVIDNMCRRNTDTWDRWEIITGTVRDLFSNIYKQSLARGLVKKNDKYTEFQNAMLLAHGVNDAEELKVFINQES